ncbi:MAG: diaminopimelate decarboxylase [Thermoguttaceae bacterium]|nr:diaminopimelate decarboxylase [Thermoguttaceae bacterium]
MQETLHFVNHRSEIAGIPVTSLVQKFGTPCFVYDAAKIQERFNDLAMFDTVRFAQKACSNLAILRLLRAQGAVVDAVSGMEIRRAIAAGFTPGQIVYTADIFDQDALDLITGDIPVHVNCGSADMIWQLGERMPNQDITLRINPGFGHGHSQKTNTGGDQSKHGIWLTEVKRCMELASHFDMRITGLHMHIGSGTDLEHLSKVCLRMYDVALDVGAGLQTISCGGGLPVPYQEDERFVDLNEYHRIWRETISKLERQFGHPINLEIEPGRYLVAESGYLISEIRAAKKQKNNIFYLVDAGFNNLARPIMYGSYHPISIAFRDSTAKVTAEQEVIVGGPLCESGDIFTQSEGGFVQKRSLPVAETGDYLILENAGAYGSVMGSNYNSKVFAPEILIEKGRAKLIRKRQTFEQLIANELVSDDDC